MVLFVLVELMRCISHVIKFMVFLMQSLLVGCAPDPNHGGTVT